MWLLYIILFGSLMCSRVYSFFSPSQPAYFYHQVLMIFTINQDHWPFPYLLTITSLILNIFTVGLLWFYTLNKKFFSAAFISVITAARLISDIGGYSYEWNTIQALFYQSQSAARLALLNLILWVTPSYLAMWDYIIRKLKSRAILLKAQTNQKAAQDARSAQNAKLKI